MVHAEAASVIIQRQAELSIKSKRDDSPLLISFRAHALIHVHLGAEEFVLEPVERDEGGDTASKQMGPVGVGNIVHHPVHKVMDVQC